MPSVQIDLYDWFSDMEFGFTEGLLSQDTEPSAHWDDAKRIGFRMGLLVREKLNA